MTDTIMDFEETPGMAVVVDQSVECDSISLLLNRALYYGFYSKDVVLIFHKKGWCKLHIKKDISTILIVEHLWWREIGEQTCYTPDLRGCVIITYASLPAVEGNITEFSLSLRNGYFDEPLNEILDKYQVFLKKSIGPDSMGITVERQSSSILDRSAQ